MLSAGFSEGETRDINEEFPSDSPSYTDSYDYLSDSDLEDDGPDLWHGDQGLESQIPTEPSMDLPLPSSQDAREAESHHM